MEMDHKEIMKENGIKKETKILVETNFRSFVFYLPFKMLLLVKPLFDKKRNKGINIHDSLMADIK